MSPSQEFFPARRPYRMASSFELSCDQPSLQAARARRLQANSYQVHKYWLVFKL